MTPKRPADVNQVATKDRSMVCGCGMEPMHTIGYCQALRAARVASVMGDPEACQGCGC